MKSISLEMEKKVVSSVQNYQNYFQTKFFNLLIAIDTPHVPKLESISSLLDLLTLCFLVIASNFLDPRTYQYPCDIPSDNDVKKMKLFDLNDIDAADRRRHSYARGLAWKITRWCEDNFEIYATNSSEQLSTHDLTHHLFCYSGKKNPSIQKHSAGRKNARRSTLQPHNTTSTNSVLFRTNRSKDVN